MVWSYTYLPTKKRSIAPKEIKNSLIKNERMAAKRLGAIGLRVFEKGLEGNFFLIFEVLDFVTFFGLEYFSIKKSVLSSSCILVSLIQKEWCG